MGPLRFAQELESYTQQLIKSGLYVDDDDMAILNIMKSVISYNVI